MGKPKQKQRKLFILWLTDKGRRLLRGDCYAGHVVRAFNRAEARGLAEQRQGQETVRGISFWLDPTLSRCEELQRSGDAGLILSAHIPREESHGLSTH